MRAVFSLVLAAAFTHIAACEPLPPSGTGPSPVPPPGRQPVAEGGMCGGFAGFMCGPGLYCEMAPGQCGRVADGSGVCRPKPQMCTREYRPVCGCDGQTYGNACTAAADGVSLRGPGECQPD